MERSTAEDWLIRAMGRTAYDALWKPMLIGKFGEVYREVTMAWFWARIHTRTVRLGSYVGGFQRFLDDFAGKLEQQGVTLRMNTPVKGIQQHDGRSNVTTAVGSHSFDAAISTTSPAAMLKLAPDLPTTYAERLRNLRHMGAAVVVLALDRQFMTDGTYWLNLPASSPDKANSEFPFLALVEHTNYLDRVNYGGDHVLYMGDYIVPDHEYLTMSEDALVDRFIDALPRLRPDFKRDWIRKQWVFRTSYAQPIPFVNHSQHIPDLYTGVPGLYLASMSQVYPWDRGTNYAVQIGREVARRVMADATSRHGKITETRTR
jgi:protoporphyrinogen oxidase